jgi:hypothetical protein
MDVSMDVKRHYAQPVRAFELRQTSVLWAAKTRLQQIVTAVALNLVRLGAVYPASSDPDLALRCPRTSACLEVRAIADFASGIHCYSERQFI